MSVDEAAVDLFPMCTLSIIPVLLGVCCSRPGSLRDVLPFVPLPERSERRLS